MNKFESLLGKLLYAGLLVLILWKPVSFVAGEVMSWHEKNYVPRESVKPNFLGMTEEPFSKLMTQPQIGMMKTDDLHEAVKELTEGKPEESGLFSKPAVKTLFPNPLQESNSNGSSSNESH